jgi:hypothetical protein
LVSPAFNAGDGQVTLAPPSPLKPELEPELDWPAPELAEPELPEPEPDADDVGPEPELEPAALEEPEAP